mgnify:CR=1
MTGTHEAIGAGSRIFARANSGMTELGVWFLPPAQIAGLAETIRVSCSPASQGEAEAQRAPWRSALSL